MFHNVSQLEYLFYCEILHYIVKFFTTNQTNKVEIGKITHGRFGQFWSYSPYWCKIEQIFYCEIYHSMGKLDNFGLIYLKGL